MSISQKQMVEMVRADVVDSIDSVGFIETANVYGVERRGITELSTAFIDRCVAAELERAYA